MSRERIVLIVVAVLAVGALLFAGAAGGQRSAWMEGYMMGRLSAAGGGAEAAGAGAPAAMLPYAPYAPYAPYGAGFVHRGPGFGGILLVLGAVAFGLFLCRFAHRARWARWQAWMAMGGAPGGAPGSPQGDWRQGPPPPWMHGPWGRGPWGQNPWTAQPSASTEQGQPSQQPQQPPQPPQPPAGDPPAQR